MLEPVGEKRIGIKTTGSEKERYTVVLATSFTGEKLQASIKFEGKSKKLT
jgi:hypothetical protein